jgi:hypothetical protein
MRMGNRCVPESGLTVKVLDCLRQTLRYTRCGDSTSPSRPRTQLPRNRIPNQGDTRRAARFAHGDD